MPYAPTTSKPLVSYTPMPSSALSATLLPSGTKPPDTVRTNHDITPELVQQYTRHVFEGRFTPLKLVVNGRKGRRVIAVLGSDRKHYRVLDMDFTKTGRKAEESSGSEDEGTQDEDVEMVGA
jgi:anaphase-promoting complex subunit 4